jgi:sigma-B regulation protein RsbU (phosphoserine phosphatase)
MLNEGERQDTVIKDLMQNAEQHLLWAKVFNHALEGIIVTDHQVRIQHINPSFTAITGYGNEVLGKNPNILKSHIHDTAFYQQMWREIKDKGHWSGEIWNKRRSGELYVQWTTITCIRDDNELILGYAAIFTDITERTKSEQKLKEDLELAKQVQQKILTPRLNDDRIDLEGLYIPSLELAGDFYCWYKIDEKQYGVIIIDIMGHGVASSLVCMSISSQLRRMITSLKDPSIVFKELNAHMRSLYSENKQGLPYYFTGIYAVLDMEEKKMEYVCAGHPPGFLINRKGEIKRLETGTVPIGLLEEITVEKEQVQFKPGDALVLFSDGILDLYGRSADKNLEKLGADLLRYREADSSKWIQRFISFFEETYGPYQDDISMVIANIK